jgi:hypothetical protein
MRTLGHFPRPKADSQIDHAQINAVAVNERQQIVIEPFTVRARKTMRRTGINLQHGVLHNLRRAH